MATQTSPPRLCADVTHEELQRVLWALATDEARHHLERHGLPATAEACHHLVYGLWLNATDRLNGEFDLDSRTAAGQSVTAPRARQPTTSASSADWACRDVLGLLRERHS
jgi:hypothetical protein